VVQANMVMIHFKKLLSLLPNFKHCGIGIWSTQCKLVL
jgi:hypothetical protein